MSETPEAPETSEDSTTDNSDQQQDDQLPKDHPVIRQLTAYKSQIKELNVKAKRLAELEDAAKTTEEKTADRIAQAEAEAASVPAKVADALRTHLIAMHSIDQEDAELFLTATDPELMLKQVERLIGQSDKRRKNHVPREGQTPVTAAGETSDMREFTRALFGGE